ncbi:hypothetical protein Pcinc_029277, partial [Petrolisthes cinctipes]
GEVHQAPPTTPAGDDSSSTSSRSVKCVVVVRASGDIDQQQRRQQHGTKLDIFYDNDDTSRSIKETRVVVVYGLWWEVRKTERNTCSSEQKTRAAVMANVLLRLIHVQLL